MTLAVHAETLTRSKSEYWKNISNIRMWGMFRGDLKKNNVLLVFIL
jgi:hypothetical protein